MLLLCICLSVGVSQAGHVDRVHGCFLQPILHYVIGKFGYLQKLEYFCMEHIHTRLTALFSGTTRVSRYQKIKPIWILLKQETVSGSGISWAICKSAPRSRQITTPVPHHSVFYRPDALPAAQSTASKHWRQTSLWNFVPNSGLGKFRHGKSIVLLTKLVDSRACWPHLRLSTCRD